MSPRGKRPASVQTEGRSWQRAGPVPRPHYRQLRGRLIRIPAGAEKASVPPAALPKALICQRGGEITGRQISPVSRTVKLFCLRIKDKRTELGKQGSRAAALFEDGQPFKPPERALLKMPISLGEGDYKQIKLHSL